MAEEGPPGRTGREGMGAKERQQKRDAEDFARTPIGRELASLRAEIVRLTARLAAEEQAQQQLEGDVDILKSRPIIPQPTGANQFLGSGVEGFWHPIDSKEC